LNFLRTVFALCTGFKAYRAVCDVPFGSSLKYLLKLMLALAALLMISFIPWLLGQLNSFARWVDENFPPFEIRQGRVQSSVEQPYYAGDTNFLFVLDTTGTVTEPDPRAAQGVLFMAETVLMWVRTTNDAVRSQRHSLQGFPDGAVNGEYFRRLARTALWVGLPVSFAAVALLGTLSALLQAYMFSVVAAFMERTLPVPLRFAQLLNIAIHAVTPAAIIATVYMALRLRGINFWLIYLIAYGVFLVGATNACRDGTENR
jgi:hypothetical protein